MRRKYVIDLAAWGFPDIDSFSPQKMTELWSVSVTGATSKGAASMPAAFQNEERPTPAVVASKIKKERTSLQRDHWIRVILLKATGWNFSSAFWATQTTQLWIFRRTHLKMVRLFLEVLPWLTVDRFQTMTFLIVILLDTTCFHWCLKVETGKVLKQGKNLVAALKQKWQLVH